MVKNSPAKGSHKRLRFGSWVGKIPWKRKWQPAPVFLPGKFHGQRSLAGYSPWVPIESDTAEPLSFSCSWISGSGIPIAVTSHRGETNPWSGLHHSGSVSLFLELFLLKYS